MINLGVAMKLMLLLLFSTLISCGKSSSGNSDPSITAMISDIPASIDERTEIQLSSAESTSTNGDIVRSTWSIETEEEPTLRYDIIEVSEDISNLVLNEAWESANIVIHLEVEDEAGNLAATSRSLEVLEVDKTSLPSFPQEKDATSVAAIDLNSNGFRDDIEVLTYELLKEKPISEREIFLQASVVLQNKLDAMSNPDITDVELDQLSETSSLAIACLMDFTTIDSPVDLLQIVAINNDVRTKAYLDFQRTRIGVVTQPRSNISIEDCNFLE